MESYARKYLEFWSYSVIMISRDKYFYNFKKLKNKKLVNALQSLALIMFIYYLLSQLNTYGTFL